MDTFDLLLTISILVVLVVIFRFIHYACRVEPMKTARGMMVEHVVDNMHKLDNLPPPFRGSLEEMRMSNAPASACIYIGQEFDSMNKKAAKLKSANTETIIKPIEQKCPFCGTPKVVDASKKCVNCGGN